MKDVNETNAHTGCPRGAGCWLILGILPLNYVCLLFLTLFLFDRYSLEIAGMALLLLGWSEGVSSLTASFLKTLDVAGPHPKRDKVLCLQGVFFLSAMVGALGYFAVWPVFASFPEAVLILALQSSILLYLKFFAPTGGAGRSVIAALISGRYIFAFAVILALVGLRDFQIEHALYAVCAACFLLLCVQAISARKVTFGPFYMSAGQSTNQVAIFKLVTQAKNYVDILVVPFLFNTPDLAVYLAARAFAALACPAVLILGIRTRHLLQESYRHERNEVFARVAARLNLGLFLIGGGSALIPLALGKICAPLLGENQSLFIILLFWLVAVQSCAFIFGSFSEIFRVSGKVKRVNLFSVNLLIFFLTYCILDGSLLIIDYVVVIFALHFLNGLISAIIVARNFGIWPGPTALFFGQIRLFQRTTNSA